MYIEGLDTVLVPGFLNPGTRHEAQPLMGVDERMDSGKYQWNILDLLSFVERRGWIQVKSMGIHIIDLLSLVEMRGWIQVNYLTAYDFRHKPKVHRPNFLILTLSVPDIHFFKSIAHF